MVDFCSAGNSFKVSELLDKYSTVELQPRPGFWLEEDRGGFKCCPGLPMIVPGLKGGEVVDFDFQWPQA